MAVCYQTDRSIGDDKVVVKEVRKGFLVAPYNARPRKEHWEHWHGSYETGGIGERMTRLSAHHHFLSPHSCRGGGADTVRMTGGDFVKGPVVCEKPSAFSVS